MNQMQQFSAFAPEQFVEGPLREAAPLSLTWDWKSTLCFTGFDNKQAPWLVTLDEENAVPSGYNIQEESGVYGSLQGQLLVRFLSAPKTRGMLEDQIRFGHVAIGNGACFLGIRTGSVGRIGMATLNLVSGEILSLTDYAGLHWVSDWVLSLSSSKVGERLLCSSDVVQKYSPLADSY